MRQKAAPQRASHLVLTTRSSLKTSRGWCLTFPSFFSKVPYLLKPFHVPKSKLETHHSEKDMERKVSALSFPKVLSNLADSLNGLSKSLIDLQTKFSPILLEESQSPFLPREIRATNELILNSLSRMSDALILLHSHSEELVDLYSKVNVQYVCGTKVRKSSLYSEGYIFQVFWNLWNSRRSCATIAWNLRLFPFRRASDASRSVGQAFYLCVSILTTTQDPRKDLLQTVHRKSEKARGCTKNEKRGRILRFRDRK